MSGAKMRIAKFCPPELPDRCISRPSLLSLFDTASEKRIVRLDAPAGYGKTVSALLWLKAAKRKTVWLLVDPYDNNPATFYRRFCTALASAHPNDAGLKRALESPGFDGAPVQYTLQALSSLSASKARRIPRALVLDDVHQLNHDEIRRSLAFVLQHLGDEYVVLLLGREPNIFERPLTGVLRDGVASIGAEHLKFSSDEIRLCFAAFGRALNDRDTRAVLKATYGWPIAVAAMAMTNTLPAEPQEERDVFAESVRRHFWSTYDSDVRTFLLKTSLAEELLPELCERLTGSADSERILKKLAESQLLTHSVSGKYVHHRLFRNFLRERLEEDASIDKNALYAVLAEYYRSVGEHFRAVHYAFESGDEDSIALALDRVMSHDCHKNSIADYVDSMKTYIQNGIPEGLPEKYPYLYINIAWFAHLTGDSEGMYEALDKLYEAMPQIEAHHGRFMEKAVRAHCLDNRFPEGGFFGRLSPDMLARVMDAQLHFPTMTKNLPSAHRGSRDMSGYPGLPEDPVDFDRTAFLWGDGHATYAAAIRAGLWYEKNALTEALESATSGVVCLPASAPPGMVFFAKMTAAAVMDAMDRTEEAEKQRAEICRYLKDTDAFYLYPNFMAYEIKLRLMDGDKDAADEWLANYFVIADIESDIDARLELYRIYQHLTTARAMMVRCGLGVVRAFIRKLIRLAKDFDRLLDATEAMVLLSILEWNCGDKTEAIDILQEALLQVKDHHYIRVFAEEGAALLPLLKKLMTVARRQRQLKGIDYKYLNEIYMVAYARSKRRKGIACVMPTKPAKLSKRQKLMLSLLAQGFRNVDIAGETGLSPHTVKVHLFQAYRKLGVHNAPDAVLKAREQGDID